MNNTKQNQLEKEVTSEAVMNQTVADFKNSAVVVSVLVNLFILTTWLVIAVSDHYSAQAVMLLS